MPAAYGTSCRIHDQHGRRWLQAREKEGATVGSGDTAASVVVALLNNVRFPEQVSIDIFCRKGMLYTRNESLGDFKLWGNPTGWDGIPWDGRMDFIWRTERGVCSSIFKVRIDAAQNVRILPGMVREARMRGTNVRLTIQDEAGNRRLDDNYKRVVVAIGFRRWAFQTLFRDQSIFPIFDKKKYGDKWEKRKEEEMSKRIREDLSYECDKFDEPRLFLPTLAAFNCGPGFSNLGCLGSVSERIIDSCIAPIRK